VQELEEITVRPKTNKEAPLNPMALAGNDGRRVLIAGLSNTVGKSYNGLQIAGLVNVARHVSGVQIAGVVNIADDSDCPVGLINLIKNGEKGIALTYSETGSTVVSFRSGGKITYGIVGIGYNHKTELLLISRFSAVPVLIICKLKTCLMQRCFRPIPCGKSMAHPNFSRCMSVIKQAFNMSFEYAAIYKKKNCIPK
jgi:hypothetical protein